MFTVSQFRIVTPPTQRTFFQIRLCDRLIILSFNWAVKILRGINICVYTGGGGALLLNLGQNCQSMVKMSTLSTILILVNLAVLILAKYPCDVTVSVDISDGERNEVDESITKDGVTYPKEQYFEYEGKTLGCLCNLRSCIKKCCPMGKYMSSDKECIETQEDFTQDLTKITSADVNTYSIINVPCNSRSFILNPLAENEKIVIDDKGVLVWGEPVEEEEEFESYCVDYIEDTDDVKVLVCNVEGAETQSNTHNSIGTFLV